MIKAIFFDIDGTLVPFGVRRISEPVIQALEKLREQGIKLFISTGRPINFVKDSDWGFTFDGIIAMSGQYCVVENELILENWLDAEALYKMMTYANEQEFSCALMEENYVYNNLPSPEWPEVNIDDISRIKEHKVYQVSPNVPAEQALKLLEFMPNCKTSYWNPNYFDIIPADGGKQNGIKHMLKHFDLTAEESMAFGDSNNDVDMLKFVGIGVAMGNATDETKAVADYICDDVKNNGIVSALKHFKLI